MSYSIEDAKKAFENDVVEKDKKNQDFKNYIIIKRIILIGFIDGFKLVEIER